ncbi:MAG: helix-turn-helix domain-containing protein [Candidatus Omnitrophica bacterium]|nr:helix-turn-helix domain-containing protein [Candidatus Omnitrophota bacterium]
MGRGEPLIKRKQNLLTTREASQILGLAEKEVIELSKAGEIPFYRVAGEFLRFKKSDILNVKYTIQKRFNLKKESSPFWERVREFFYFNDFYIISGGVITVFLWLIFK